MFAFALLVTLLQAPVSDSIPPPVRVDVVVRDRGGRPIADLRRQDFELSDNGVAQKIAAVERPGAAGARAFGIVLDEFHVSPGPATERVRESLLYFIEHGLRPSDLAIVFKPLDPVTSIRFTQDREALKAAVSSFSGRQGDYTPRTEFEREYIGTAGPAVIAARAQIATAALGELSMQMGELKVDRGVIVFVSEGFEPRLASTREMRLPDLPGVVRAASRFHEVVYTLNPADASPENAGTAMLKWLAAQTGGSASLDGTRLSASLDRMIQDLDASYSLTFQPANADGKFHRLDVRAKRRNVEVLARPGYWAPFASELRAAAERAAAPPLLGRRTLHRSAVITTWTGLTTGDLGRMRLVLTWEPRLRDARSVVVHARTESGTPLFDGPVAPIGEDGDLPDSAAFDVPPGRVQVDLEIRSTSGAALDSDQRDIDVPDLSRRKGPVILTPQIVRAASARQYRLLVNAGNAPPAPARVFARGDRLLVRVPVWEASGAPVTVTVTIANQWGQKMRDVDRAESTIATPQFDLPLAWLVPGEYLLELNAKSPGGEVKERLAFTVARQ